MNAITSRTFKNTLELTCGEEGIRLSVREGEHKGKCLSVRKMIGGTVCAPTYHWARKTAEGKARKRPATDTFWGPALALAYDQMCVKGYFTDADVIAKAAE